LRARVTGSGPTSPGRSSSPTQAIRARLQFPEGYNVKVGTELDALRETLRFNGAPTLGFGPQWKAGLGPPPNAAARRRREKFADRARLRIGEHLFPKITEEVAVVFNTLTGLASYPGLEKLLVAPFDSRSGFIRVKMC
jgi:hypothetical protein